MSGNLKCATIGTRANVFCTRNCPSYAGRGLNSGRPSKKPNPNCFVLSTTSTEDKEFFYWLLFGLWQSKAFHSYLRGSVIPFIIIKELQKIIIQASDKAQANHAKFNKAISSLKQLDLLEKAYQKIYN